MFRWENQDAVERYLYSPIVVSSFATGEWALYAVSISFNDAAKTTDISMHRNAISHTHSSLSGYYKETDGIIHYIGSNMGASGFYGFLYSFGMYNYARNPAQIQTGLGSCSGCSACPASLNSCISTCSKNQYADSNKVCQSCLSSCQHTCSRADTCNLCFEDLCYKCTKYEIGFCTECVTNASLSSGKCKCNTGFVKQGSECIDTCNDGFYLDLGVEECVACPTHCKKCIADICLVCESEFVIRNDVCSCPEGYFIDDDVCQMCDSSCATCDMISSNCTTCVASSPILMSDNACYPCASFQGYGFTYVVPIGGIDTSALAQLTQKCVEICGDMRNMGQSECDDGNNRNGDGCSITCDVENG